MAFVQKDRWYWTFSALSLLASASLVPRPSSAPVPVDGPEVAEEGTEADAIRMIREGRNTFRDDTFGDEDFWGGELRLHEAVATLSPMAALHVGLKVDAERLPPKLIKALVSGNVNLEDPAVTLQLLELNAVVGVTGFLSDRGELESIGIQCALCHSTVDDALLPGIGRRLDGWANRDLDIGAIVAMAPNLAPMASLLGVPQNDVREVLRSWGPGKFDAELLLDGKTEAPSGVSGATLIPPAFGLAGVNLHTWTGWGSVTHWNAFVATIEMHGKGTFFDPRLDDAQRFPIAAVNGFGHIRNEPDLITSKLAALHFYQLALVAPAPPEGSFNAIAAERGDVLFEGKAGCASCHVEPLFTEPGWNMHKPEEIGVDNFQSERAPDRQYRTTPLKGLWTHQKGGFFHDGRFPSLLSVVEHYDHHFDLGLTAGEKQDLVQYLLSL